MVLAAIMRKLGRLRRMQRGSYSQRANLSGAARGVHSLLTMSSIRMNACAYNLTYITRTTV